MAGIYIHIPFCRKACHYCDFHFSVSLERKDELLVALLKEIELRKDFFPESTEIGSIYFGGGTPSVLSSNELNQIIEKVKSTFHISEDLEICVEANPDDLTNDYLKDLQTIRVNRLSVGIQSLDQSLLDWMNRSHDVEQARKAIKNAARFNFDSITIDLIYGVPGLSSERWREQLKEVLGWPIDHLSAYGLTLEEKTAYAKYVRTGSYLPPDDKLMVDHYRILQEQIGAHGWEQYEVSNYAKDQKYSKHNTAYWFNEPYLGIGPSAHSYNGNLRSWNRSSNAAYIQAISKGDLLQEIEVLDLEDQINEYLLTRMRTLWGVDMTQLLKLYGYDLATEQAELIDRFEKKGWMENKDGKITLTKEGMLFADHISSELFIDHSSQRSS